MGARIAPKTHRTASVGQCGGAKCASSAICGIQLFRCPPLWTLWACFSFDVVKRACFARGSVAFGTSLFCFFTNTTRNACRGSLNFRSCIHSTLCTITTQSGTLVWVFLARRAFVAIVRTRDAFGRGVRARRTGDTGYTCIGAVFRVQLWCSILPSTA